MHWRHPGSWFTRFALSLLRQLGSPADPPRAGRARGRGGGRGGDPDMRPGRRGEGREAPGHAPSQDGRPGSSACSLALADRTPGSVPSQGPGPVVSHYLPDRIRCAYPATSPTSPSSASPCHTWTPSASIAGCTRASRTGGRRHRCRGTRRSGKSTTCSHGLRSWRREPTQSAPPPRSFPRLGFFAGLFCPDACPAGRRLEGSASATTRAAMAS